MSSERFVLDLPSLCIHYFIYLCYYFDIQK